MRRLRILPGAILAWLGSCWTGCCPAAVVRPEADRGACAGLVAPPVPEDVATLAPGEGACRSEDGASEPVARCLTASQATALALRVSRVEAWAREAWARCRPPERVDLPARGEPANR